MADSYDVAVVGAGIAGVSAAYFLSVRHGLRTVLVDHRPPLTLTSDKSTECYRNWWPGPGPEMVAFMNRSIDLLEEWALESANAFNLNRRGYLFVTGDPDRLALLRTGAEETSNLGGGPLRCHPGGQDAYRESPAGGWEGQPVTRIMTEDPVTVAPDVPVAEAARLLLEQKIGALPVRDGDRIVGIFTTADALEALLVMVEEHAA